MRAYFEQLLEAWPQWTEYCDPLRSAQDAKNKMCLIANLKFKLFSYKLSLISLHGGKYVVT
jgi:hypothetical protein